MLLARANRRGSRGPSGAAVGSSQVGPGVVAALVVGLYLVSASAVSADEDRLTRGGGTTGEGGPLTGSETRTGVSSEEAFDEALDEISIDVQSSIDAAIDSLKARFSGDIRVSYLFTGQDLQDVQFGQNDVLRMRWRLAADRGFSRGFRGAIRIAGLCSTEDCSPDFVLDPDISGRASVRDGEVTIDSAFLQWFRSERYDIAIGRMETKFVARGGVFSKSMDRNDSNNLRVNWTDGLHSTYRGVRGWDSHLIIQYNDKDGAGNIRRFPLDFSSGKSRASYYVAVESKKALRRMVQRSVSVSYLPSSLAVNGLSSPVREAYLGVVGRVALRWPVRDEGWRIRASGELAYARDTPARSVLGIAGEGGADGLAWAATVSVMDFLPRQSVGFNYARTGAGWLLSPQYAPNEELYEVRYVVRPTARISLDVRARWRYKLEERLIPDPSTDNFDFYARTTWSFGN